VSPIKFWQRYSNATEVCVYSTVTKYTYFNQNRRSKYISEQQVYSRFRTQAQTSTTTNHANVDYDLLTYNMASATLTTESSRKWRRCHLMCYQGLADRVMDMRNPDSLTEHIVLHSATHRTDFLG